MDGDLPEPDSDELVSLISSSPLRLLYGLLYRRRDSPPTMAEVRLFMATALGEDQVHFDRRLRELRDHFDIPAESIGGEFRYPLRGWRAAPRPSDEPRISLRLRAQVLAPQRCAQCGRTPLEDGVKLVIDHRVPRAWGGTTEPENLQPLCQDCNAGKRDYFRTFAPYADEIRRAANYDEPQRRIGELLKAFGDEWVRTDLLAVVASAKEYQEDWQRRLRDLRFLGWDYEHKKQYDQGARVWTYYRLVRSAPWPPNIHAAIRAEEQRRKAERGRRSAGAAD